VEVLAVSQGWGDKYGVHNPPLLFMPPDHIVPLSQQQQDGTALLFFFFFLIFQYWGRQVLYHLSHTPSFLALPFFFFFWDRVLLYVQTGLDCDPPIDASCIAKMPGAHHYTHLLLAEMGVSWTVCPGWPQTLILLFSARITVVSCQCLALLHFLLVFTIGYTRVLRLGITLYI
jgi:hypothetical protein